MLPKLPVGTQTSHLLVRAFQLALPGQQRRRRPTGSRPPGAPARPQLMEFADERATSAPARQMHRRKAPIGEHLLGAGLGSRRSCPRTAHTPTLLARAGWPSASCWMSAHAARGDTRYGHAHALATSRKPSRAALPVSPEVATRMQELPVELPLGPQLGHRGWPGRSAAGTCSAMSLKAQVVGPCHSSSTWVFSERVVTGQISGVSKALP